MLLATSKVAMSSKLHQIRMPSSLRCVSWVPIRGSFGSEVGGCPFDFEDALMDRLPSWTGRDGREPVSFPAYVVVTGREVPVTICNISEDGCQIECAETLTIGANISLRLDLVSLGATIRWAFDGKAGLRFVKK